MHIYRLEILDGDRVTSCWDYTTREERDAVLDLLRDCPVDDGPITCRLTTLRGEEPLTVQVHAGQVRGPY